MYTVVILAEQAMSAADAAEVTSLHEAIEDTRHYHVVIPCENAAQQVETALSSLAASDVLVAPPPAAQADGIDQAQRAIDSSADDDVSASVAAIRALDLAADGEFTREDPVDALARIVQAESADEVVVMTRPHVVAEFLHLDWASRARRHLGVPVLHLVEHEPLDAEAGTGQGITGM